MRLVNRAENWERAYEAFQQVNFAAWDYQTIKQSLLDYMKIYRPEDFTDFIESSEFIAILEIFAYVGELIAYRLDLNAHENFISTAERKESVLRLAKLLSYSSSRNIPLRGLVKITSISTTERVFDGRGLDLSNRVIYWNDRNNPNWKEQFILVINKVLSQDFGTVLESDRTQVRDVLFEIYELNNTPMHDEVLKFSTTVSNVTLPMEIVPVKLDKETGPYERRPQLNQKMSILYLSDGLGDTSDNTGFFYFIKQGELGKITTRFDGVTPNQYYDIKINGCNETDVWVNNVDDDGVIINNGDVSNPILIGEWEKVDIANSQNVLFNTNPNKNKYEIETLNNDNFRIIFGDGKFAQIPSGKFDIWYRTSTGSDMVIPTTSIQNQTTTINYTNSGGREETITTTFSLVSAIQNGAPSEDIDHIKRIAPAVYYTQDRMVNGRDYNEFMLQDNSILKLRAINRTFAGDSKYIKWHDPREYYENVKIFGDDLTVYFKTVEISYNVDAGDLPEPDGLDNELLVNSIILNHLTSILQDEPYFIKTILGNIAPNDIRKEFSDPEILELSSMLSAIINNPPDTIYLKLNLTTNIWEFYNNEDSVPSDWDLSVEIENDGNWIIIFKGFRIICHSDDVRFWITNEKDKVITYDILNPNFDNIVILKANTGYNSSYENILLDRNYKFRVLRQEMIENGIDIGTNSIHDMHILPDDVDQNGLPDSVSLAYLISPTDYVYFNRENLNSEWVIVPFPDSLLEQNSLIAKYENSINEENGLWKRERGRENLNFAWFHRTSRYHLIDPSASNIIDMFIIPRGYYLNYRLWLSDRIENEPILSSPHQLTNDYAHLLESKMISDTVIIHPGKFKVIFGNKAKANLRATIKIIRPTSGTTLTNNQVKTTIVDLVNKFFEIDKWEFGETFYFSELSAYIHLNLPTEIDSVVIVPLAQDQAYGDMQQIFAKEDEIIQPHISVNDITIIESLNPKVLRQSV